MVVVSEQKEKSLKGLDEYEPNPKSSDINRNAVTQLAIDRVPGNPLSSRQTILTNWAQELGNACPPFVWVVVPHCYSQTEFVHARYPLNLFPHMPDQRVANKEDDF